MTVYIIVSLIFILCNFILIINASLKITGVAYDQLLNESQISYKAAQNGDYIDWRRREHSPGGENLFHRLDKRVPVKRRLEFRRDDFELAQIGVVLSEPT